MSREGVKLAEILRRLTAQFAAKTLSTTQVYDWHKKISGGRESVRCTAHAPRPRTSTSETNIFVIREIIQGDRSLTIWGIAADVEILYGGAQGSPKSVDKVSVDGRSGSKPSYRLGKTFGTISSRWGLVMRRGCIITSQSLSRQAWSDRNLEKQHHGKPRLVSLMQQSFCNVSWGSQRDIAC